MYLFTLAEVAALAKIELQTARLWFDRNLGHFTYFNDDQLAVAGGTRRLSPNTALAVCIAADLKRLGAALPRAAMAGMTFGHTASGSPSRGKIPGEIYGGSTLTLLALPADGTPNIFPVSAKSDPINVLVMIGDGAIVLPINPIFERIKKAAIRSAETASTTARVRALKSRTRSFAEAD